MPEVQITIAPLSLVLSGKKHVFLNKRLIQLTTQTTAKKCTKEMHSWTTMVLPEAAEAFWAYFTFHHIKH